MESTEGTALMKLFLNACSADMCIDDAPLPPVTMLGPPARALHPICCFSTKIIPGLPGAFGGGNQSNNWSHSLLKL